VIRLRQSGTCQRGSETARCAWRLTPICWSATAVAAAKCRSNCAAWAMAYGTPLPREADEIIAACGYLRLRSR
jgi:hypothetical protein